jgi:hypothetical protein
MLGAKHLHVIKYGVFSLFLFSCEEKKKTNVVDRELLEAELTLAHKFTRPPLLASLQAGGTELTFIGLHTAGLSAVQTEAKLLDDVVDMSSRLGFGGKVLLMGDWGLGCSYASESFVNALEILQTFSLLIPHSADTTTSDSSCAFDRALANFPGSAFVFEQHSINAYSDHKPIAADVAGFGRVCSWNAQNLSSRKVAENSGLLAAGSELFSVCDVSFIQEIEDGSGIRALADSASREVHITPKLGIASQKECFALVSSASHQVTRFHVLGAEMSEGACDAAMSWLTVPPEETGDSEGNSSAGGGSGSGNGGSGSGSGYQCQGDSGCGREIKWTERGYCTAKVGSRRQRVCDSCCRRH